MAQSIRGPSLLAKWRKREGLSQADAGKLIGVTATSVCEWEGNKKTPDGENLLRIHAITGGAVPIESWLKDRDQQQAIRESRESDGDDASTEPR